MKNSKSDFQNIPGVGPNMEKHLLLLGYKSISDLKGENPEQMYENDKLIHGENLDRCVLYVYRLAVYYANNQVHEVEKLKWWNWKD